MKVLAMNLSGDRNGVYANSIYATAGQSQPFQFSVGQQQDGASLQNLSSFLTTTFDTNRIYSISKARVGSIESVVLSHLRTLQSGCWNATLQTQRIHRQLHLNDLINCSG